MVKNDIKQEIIKLYYEEHKRTVDIAPIINKSPQYVSKVAKKRYTIWKWERIQT